MPAQLAAGAVQSRSMPSLQHEALLELFRNRPALAPELLRDALQVELPKYTEARIASADLNQVQPTEYRADLVVLLLDDKPVLGIVVEVQLDHDDRKDYVWPAYVATLRARLECPVLLLVVATDESTSRQAGRIVDLGGGNLFRPLVLGPSGVPVVTDEAIARADPELAVLSAMSHGQDADVECVTRIAIVALQASRELGWEHAKLYSDLIDRALSEAARRALQTMAIPNYQYQGPTFRKIFAEGKAEGKTEGKADLVARQLARRFGPLPQNVVAHLTAASIEELDAIGERLLTAQSLQEALGS